MFTQKVKTLLINIFILTSLLTNAQRQTSTSHHEYKVRNGVTLNINVEYTDLTIIESNSDSIIISTSISIQPSNYKTPFLGISRKNVRQDSTTILTQINVGEEIEPSNELKSKCTIAIPKYTRLSINSRYSTVNLQTLSGRINANLSYCDFMAEPLNSGTDHQLYAYYSAIAFTSLDNELTLEGNNIKLNADYIKTLKAKTEFSNISVEKTEQIDAKSYTDKFILNRVNSITLNSEYSSCTIEYLSDFLQSEMTYGSLSVSGINKTFKTINIANSYVNTRLNLDKESAFFINADMRYCELIQDKISLESTSSPSSTLFNGIYGNANDTSSNIALISAFGDINISFR